MTKLTSNDHASIFATRGYQDLKRLGLAQHVTDEQMERIAAANFHESTSLRVRDEVIAAHDGAPVSISQAIAALYFLIFDREPDAPGLRFYAGLYRNGVKLSFLVADMERNKAAGAK